MSTMLFDWSTGDSGLGRPGTAEQRGITKRVRFSYSAKSRSILVGVALLCFDLDVDEE